MGVNPVTGGDGAMLIKEIREGRGESPSRLPDFHPSSAVPSALTPAEAIRSFCREKGRCPWRGRMRRGGG